MIAFNTNAYLTAQTGTVPSVTHIPYIRANGGTNPSAAIRDTWSRLQGVDAAHKVVVAVTDGDWSGGSELMHDMTRNGVITVGVLLGHPQTSNHDVAKAMTTQYGAVMPSPLGMVALFEQVVTSRMAETLADEGHHNI